MHSAVSRPGSSTNGVVIVFCGSVQLGWALVMSSMLTASLLSLGRKAFSSPDPPPSAAGLVQAATVPAALSPWPNMLLEGGGESARKLEKAIAQPVCAGARQS